MRTKDIIEGLTILEKYQDTPDGSICGAEHGQLFAFDTDQPVVGDDLDRLIEMGWFQEDADLGEDRKFMAKHYDPSVGWAAYI